MAMEVQEQDNMRGPKGKCVSCNRSITDNFKKLKSLGLDRIDFRVLLEHV